MESVLSMNNESIIHKLRELPVFKIFEKKDIRKILSFSTIQTFSPDEVLIEEGSFDERVYFLISGRVRILKQGEEIGELQRIGDIFGEMCIIDGVARSASVIAEGEALCLVTDMSFIDHMYPEDKTAFSAIFFHVIAEVLATRLREANEEVVRVKEELARLIQQQERQA